MDARSAAIEVLRRAGTALRGEELARKMLAEGLWRSGGKTPWTTVSSMIYISIRDEGDDSPFVKVAKRTFALRGSAADRTTSAHVRHAAPEGVKSMDARSAAIAVLRRAGTALRGEELARRMLVEGLWRSGGKTPWTTVSSMIYISIRDEGDDSPFVKVAKRTFALRDSVADRRDGGLPFTDCAEKVLAESGDKKPMHYKTITDIATQKGWLISSGKTPAATLNSQVVSEIRRQQKRGERPRFVRHGQGYVGLSRWMGEGLAFEINRHNQHVRKTLHSRVLSMSPDGFERLVSELLVEMGFESVEVSKRSGDGGIDVRGTLVVGDVVRIQMAVQAKRWKLRNNVQAPVVQQVRGSLGAHEQGLIITTSDFSAGAVKEAAQPDKTPIALMNGEELVLLLIEHGIGVSRSPHELFAIDEEF